MAYQLSATKLQSYQQCPQAYYFRYERGIKPKSFGGADALGNALHNTLADIYWKWSYLEPKPPRSWIEKCWSQHTSKLKPAQVQEGEEILNFYYDFFIATETAMRKPLAVEGQIKANLAIANIEFALSGRYDRIDWLEDGLELIDYKSSKKVKEFLPEEVDLQLGLYYLALEKKYGKSLKCLSLLYLRTGDKITFDCGEYQKVLVEETISELALRLREDCVWEPAPGEHCSTCSYSRYCSAVQENPEPLPENAKKQRGLQLVLDL
ncbi:PD-(D/E)XK nuclease family protein [Ancylothrix sp. C2]|uniref:RecB family exonuclease n=1 Tax=Ancylothrix sp. D3o TaxID=2953691 RepID=UPI0021BB0191|nr:PD-(D/E)XK nuclease family protein [Ancylothrix sp. D3o]MCT7949810.1 PD-(D/E)XK nuclease family protein [Ancylothrix sp. D3o]